MEQKRLTASLSTLREFHSKSKLIILLAFMVLALYHFVDALVGTQVSKLIPLLLSGLWSVLGLYGISAESRRSRALTLLFWISAPVFSLALYMNGLIAIAFLPLFVLLVMLFTDGKQRHPLMLLLLVPAFIVPLVKEVNEPQVWFRIAVAGLMTYLAAFWLKRVVDQVVESATEGAFQLGELNRFTEEGGVGILDHNLTRDRLTMNDLLRRQLDLPEAQFPQLKRDDLIARILPADQARLLALYQDLEQSEGPFEIEVRSLRPGQEIGTQLCRLRKHRDVQGDLHLTGAMIDISSLRNAESQLKETIARQDQMFSIIGHELRTPAATIAMLIDEQVGTTEAAQSLAEIKRQALHLLSIIDDMKLATNRRFSAESVQNTEPLYVFATLERSIRGIAVLAEAEHFYISLEGKQANPYGHIGSPKAIQQIVQNLLKNAILHSGGDSAVVVMEFEHLPEEYTHFVISVTDNGKGIDVDYQSRMFDAFDRGDTAAEGTGLGLHICRELAQHMPDGDLVYRDAPGGGACFELSFTVKKNLKPPLQTEASDQQSLVAGKRVLLVEDTATLRMLGKALLQRQGAVVQEVEDGVQALAVIDQFNPDLVLTDIMMPNMNGYQLTAELRKRGFIKPIIGVTGATVGMESAQLIESGADRVLAKPLTPQGVETVLRSLSISPSKE